MTGKSLFHSLIMYVSDCKKKKKKKKKTQQKHNQPELEGHHSSSCHSVAYASTTSGQACQGEERFHQKRAWIM
jgi:hypothetical protein